MKWASAVSEEASLQKSLEELTGKIRIQMGEGPIDLAFLFVSSHFQKEYETIPADICESLGCKTLIGCSAGGVIGGGKEIEQKPAITLTVAQLPGVEITLFISTMPISPTLMPAQKAGRPVLIRPPIARPILFSLPIPTHLIRKKA